MDLKELGLALIGKWGQKVTEATRKDRPKEKSQVERIYDKISEAVKKVPGLALRVHIDERSNTVHVCTISPSPCQASVLSRLTDELCLEFGCTTMQTDHIEAGAGRDICSEASSRPDVSRALAAPSAVAATADWVEAPISGQRFNELVATLTPAPRGNAGRVQWLNTGGTIQIRGLQIAGQDLADIYLRIDNDPSGKKAPVVSVISRIYVQGVQPVIISKELSPQELAMFRDLENDSVIVPVFGQQINRVHRLASESMQRLRGI